MPLQVRYLADNYYSQVRCYGHRGGRCGGLRKQNWQEPPARLKQVRELPLPPRGRAVAVLVRLLRRDADGPENAAVDKERQDSKMSLQLCAHPTCKAPLCYYFHSTPSTFHVSPLRVSVFSGGIAPSSGHCQGAAHPKGHACGASAPELKSAPPRRTSAT